MKIGSRYFTMRVTEDEARASLHTVAEQDGDSGPRTATASIELELPKAFIREIRALIKEHSGEAEGAAIANLYESIRADGPPPAGVKAIKIERSLSMAGEAKGD